MATSLCHSLVHFVFNFTILHQHKDSSRHRRDWRLSCYRYIILASWTKQDSNLYSCGFNAMLYHWSYSSVCLSQVFWLISYFLIIEFTCFKQFFYWVRQKTRTSFFRFAVECIRHVCQPDIAESKGFEPLHRVNDVWRSRPLHYHSVNSPNIFAEREGLSTGSFGEPPNLLQSTVFPQDAVHKTAPWTNRTLSVVWVIGFEPIKALRPMVLQTTATHHLRRTHLLRMKKDSNFQPGT